MVTKCFAKWWRNFLRNGGEIFRKMFAKFFERCLQNFSKDGGDVVGAASRVRNVCEIFFLFFFFSRGTVSVRGGAETGVEWWHVAGEGRR